MAEHFVKCERILLEVRRESGAALKSTNLYTEESCTDNGLKCINVAGRPAIPESILVVDKFPDCRELS